MSLQALEEGCPTTRALWSYRPRSSLSTPAAKARPMHANCLPEPGPEHAPKRQCNASTASEPVARGRSAKSMLAKELARRLPRYGLRRLAFEVEGI
jgi:hypothetical protein